MVDADRVALDSVGFTGKGVFASRVVLRVSTGTGGERDSPSSGLFSTCSTLASKEPELFTESSKLLGLNFNSGLVAKLGLEQISMLASPFRGENNELFLGSVSLVMDPESNSFASVCPGVLAEI